MDFFAITSKIVGMLGLNSFFGNDYMNINELSLEIQIMIFSYFTQKELCQNVAPVCKQWHYLAYDPHLWKKIKLNLSRKNGTPEFLKDLFGRCLLLAELTVSNTDFFRDIIPHLVSNCRYLRKLHLTSCGGINSNCISLLVGYCPLVEELKIYRVCYFHPDVMSEIAKWSLLKNIKLRELGYPAEFVKDGDSEVLTIIANLFETIVSAKINLRRLTTDSLQHFVNKRGHQIRQLLFRFSRVTRDGFGALSQCPYLTELRIIDGTRLDDDNILVIKELKNLQKLKIKLTVAVTARGFFNVFEQNSLGNLLELSLKYCDRFDDTVLYAIAICCPKLKCLRITQSGIISNAGLAAISIHCRNLEELHLILMYDIRKVLFMNAPTFFPALKTLSLIFCGSITASETRAIKTLNPTLRVRDNTHFFKLITD